MASRLLVNRKTTWIVVADEAAAYFYERKARHAPLTELFQLSNEAGRKKAGELISDRGGRSFDRYGQGRHTMTKERSGPKQHASAVFAREIARKVSSALYDGSCDDVALIAAPRFLGVLRDALAKAGNVVPAAAIDKEMAGRDVEAIEKLLEENA